MTTVDMVTQKELAALRADMSEAVDTVWMIVCGALVFFMHAGFTSLEAGSVRFTSAMSILSKNLLVICISTLCWYFLGYGFAYGESSGEFVGSSKFLSSGFVDSAEYRNWFFQWAFCATAATIVSGAVAERTKQRAFAVFTVVMTSFTYPIIVHWTWSGSGFLSTGSVAYSDFAGSGIVHMTGGVAALVAAAIIGPREGRFPKNQDESFAANNVPMVATGTIILWFGWYGFNCGSTLAMNTKETGYQAGLVAMNTTLSPGIAGLVVFVFRTALKKGVRDVGALCNGILAGLVGITAGCANIDTGNTLIVGLVSGFVYCGASWCVRRAGVDDVVDAFAVHGACGLWGVIAVGLFGNPDLGGNGVFYGGDQIGQQLLGAVCITAWSGVLTAAVLLPLRLIGQHRLSPESQQNLDDKEFGGAAYSVKPSGSFVAQTSKKEIGGGAAVTTPPTLPSDVVIEESVAAA